MRPAASSSSALSSLSWAIQCRCSQASVTRPFHRSFASTAAAGSISSSSSSSARPSRRSSLTRPRRTSSGYSAVGAPQSRAFHASRAANAGDPYKILGVGKEATTPEIKKAYYALAKKFHPDSNKAPSAKEKFVEIQDAYDTLSDDSKRAAFDRFGSASQQSGFDADAYARATSSFGGSGFGDFFNGGGGGGGQQQGSDIFESLFGAFGRGGQARPGQSARVGEDIEVSITLPFIDAAKGTTRTVQTAPVIDCGTCAGSGMKAGAKKTSCATCGGSGTRTFTIQSGFTMASTCQACGGSGSTVPEGSSCGDCAGAGKVRERSTVQVKVPAGVEDGMKIRMDGKGDAPIGGKGRTGDLYVRINVLPSKSFTRQGSNLFYTVDVPFYTAILGGQARVPTLDKDVEVRVPTGTQPRDEVVLKGRGVKRLYKDESGDLVVRFNVTMPRSLSPAQKRILAQYIAETEYPGSSAYAPTAPKRPTPEAAPAPAASSAASPGFSSQAKPPPSSTEASDNSKWWATLGDDEKAADLAASLAEAAAAAGVAAAKSAASEPASSASAPAKPAAKDTKDKKSAGKKDPAPHSMLGDILAGAKRWLPKK